MKNKPAPAGNSPLSKSPTGITASGRETGGTRYGLEESVITRDHAVPAAVNFFPVKRCP